MSQTIFEHTSYRSFLKSELAGRGARNTSYSLRAFGRDLGIDAAQLTGVFKGTKGLSLGKAVKIAERLKLDARAREYFCLLVQFDNTTSPQLREMFLERINALNGRKGMVDLGLEMFRAISDWYHIAIIEMTELDGFVLEAAAVAERLGINRYEAEAAIERLQRLELIELDEKTGRWRKAHHHGLFQSPDVNLALRRYHQSMLEKASKALDEQPPAERYVGSDTFSIDVSQLEEAKELITEFRLKLVELFNRGKKRSETYHFVVELFRLTRPQGPGAGKEEAKPGVNRQPGGRER